LSKQRESKKKYGKNDEYMSHKVSYKWIRKTQVIPRFRGVLQECGILLGNIGKRSYDVLGQ